MLKKFNEAVKEILEADNESSWNWYEADEMESELNDSNDIEDFKIKARTRIEKDFKSEHAVDIAEVSYLKIVSASGKEAEELSDVAKIYYRVKAV